MSLNLAAEGQSQEGALESHGSCGSPGEIANPGAMNPPLAPAAHVVIAHDPEPLCLGSPAAIMGKIAHLSVHQTRVRWLEKADRRRTEMVVTLGPDLEAALIDVALKRGVAPEVLALQTLPERF